MNVVRKKSFLGEFHDQGDAKRIVIRRSLLGHNDTPCRQPAYQPPGVWPPARRDCCFLVTIN